MFTAVSLRLPARALAAPALAALAGAYLAVAPAAAPAAEIDHARQYRACMTLVQRDAEEAFDSALAWHDMGGGDAASHCVAAALLGLKQYAEAGRRFETLARKIKAKPHLRAELLAQAAQAWLLDGKPERADSALTAALKLNPDAADLLTDRAAARAAMKLYREAVEDLDRAIELEPGRADAFVFRASAYRYLASLDLAAADLERALALEAEHPEGLLERGIVRRLKGDKDGARRDWLEVLDVAPGTSAARAAQANLEKMDVKAP
ncbi:MAG: hypothetical protein ACE5FR_12160 [Rhodospirillales bacterium]